MWGGGGDEEGTVEAVSGHVVVLDFAESLQICYGCETERGWWFARYVIMVVVIVVVFVMAVVERRVRGVG